MKIQFALILVLAAVIAIIVSLTNRDGGEALADPTPSQEVLDLLDVIKSDAATNRRLMALEELRRTDDASTESELENLVRGSDARIAAFAAGALGRVGTESAKSRLLGIAGSTSLGTDARGGAMSAIAAHWGDPSDLDDLEDRAGTNERLQTLCEWLDENVYAD
jgi:hypothetical protein